MPARAALQPRHVHARARGARPAPHLPCRLAARRDPHACPPQGHSAGQEATAGGNAAAAAAAVVLAVLVAAAAGLALHWIRRRRRGRGAEDLRSMPYKPQADI